jgi:hypothetical protein
MITFRTKTGSCYEVDDENKRARRVIGGSNDTVRATPEWREFYERSPIEVGHTVIFCWTNETEPLPGSPDDCIRMTVTSEVNAVDNAP